MYAYKCKSFLIEDWLSFLMVIFCSQKPNSFNRSTLKLLENYRPFGWSTEHISDNSWNSCIILMILNNFNTVLIKKNTSSHAFDRVFTLIYTF